MYNVIHNLLTERKIHSYLLSFISKGFNLKTPWLPQLHVLVFLTTTFLGS